MIQTVAYLDCHSGIDEAMLLGALLDAGFPFDALQSALDNVPLKHYQIAVERSFDKGVRGTRVRVTLSDEKQYLPHLSAITDLLQATALSDWVRSTVTAIFQRVVDAKAAFQEIQTSALHLDEAGAIAAFITVIGAVVGIEFLGITQCYASALPLTSGHVHTSHGVLPVPTPTTLELLRRVQAPWHSCAVEGELITSIGAAILATLARFEMPPMTIEQVGYGLGQRVLPWPHCLRLCLGRVSSAPTVDGMETDWVTVLETHIDNMSGELLGGLMERLFAVGALDVSYAPLQMKKNRPATRLTVICHPPDEERLALLLLRETSTLGVRIQHMQRRKAARAQEEIMTPFGPMLVKVKKLAGKIVSVNPEYDACQRVAKEHGIPLIEVYEVVRRATQAEQGNNTIIT